MNKMLGKKAHFRGDFWINDKERLQMQFVAQRGKVAAKLDSSTDYLVIPKLDRDLTVRQRAASLNTKGASIKTVLATEFTKLLDPTASEIAALMGLGKNGARFFERAVGSTPTVNGNLTPTLVIRSHSFDAINLSGFDFSRVAFENCSFVGCELKNTLFSSCVRCDFSRCIGKSAKFHHCDGNVFRSATLIGAEFLKSISRCDFTEADLGKAEFHSSWLGARHHRTPTRTIFCRASLQQAKFRATEVASADFAGADLTKSLLTDCAFPGSTFRRAILDGSSVIHCNLSRSDLTAASLRNADLLDSDLSHTKFNRADLQQCNLRGAKLEGVNVSLARNFDPLLATVGSVGPALVELNSISFKAKQIMVKFSASLAGDPLEVCVDSRYLRQGTKAVCVPASLMPSLEHLFTFSEFSDAMIALARILGNRKVRYETLAVTSKRSSLSGKSLRALVMRGISEAFCQTPTADLDQRTTVAAPRRLSLDGAKRAKPQNFRGRNIKQVERAVRKVIRGSPPPRIESIESLIGKLAKKVDRSKLKKAMSMLKASRFQLFAEVADTSVTGIVKSQTDKDLIYSCWLDRNGRYACCTQNLNVCGGLHGGICKHLLVLIIGLAKSNQLDLGLVDAWAGASRYRNPELDKNAMGEVLLRYKGAEAGEVDWRPTETLPEDYYAL